jgi:hypothetical protein
MHSFSSRENSTNAKRRLRALDPDLMRNWDRIMSWKIRGWRRVYFPVTILIEYFSAGVFVIWGLIILSYFAVSEFFLLWASFTAIGEMAFHAVLHWQRREDLQPL